MKSIASIFLVTLFLLASLTGGCTGTTTDSSAKTPLVVFAAGSLIIPFNDLEKAIEIHRAELHLVTDLHVPIDVIATADASLVPMMMYTTTDPDTGLPNANWDILFASNRLALAYRPGSKYAAEINAGNWYEILSRPDVKVGLADPRFDAVGYRTLMVYALARDYYHLPTIFTDMFKGQFSFPLGIFSENGLTTVTVPEIMETKTGSHILLRGASMELIALLESGDLDYAFEYESVIRQHGLSLLALPDPLNLGEEARKGVLEKLASARGTLRFCKTGISRRAHRVWHYHPRQRPPPPGSRPVHRVLVESRRARHPARR